MHETDEEEVTHDESVLEEARKRSPSRAVRRLIGRGILAMIGVVVVAEITLQLPPIRESVRARAERTLAKRVPGATIARCAALDVTGVARFDGVRVPIGGAKAAVILDGFEVAPKIGALLFGEVVLKRVLAEDVRIEAGGLSLGPAPGSHLSLAVKDPDRLVRGTSQTITIAAPHASPQPTPEPIRLAIAGEGALCRDASHVAAGEEASGLTADGKRHCVIADSHAELELFREETGARVRWQAFGDRVRLLGEDAVGLPPLAAHGEATLTRSKSDPAPSTHGTASISAGPHGEILIKASLEKDSAEITVDASTDSFAALAKSMPFSLPQITEMRVDGPIKAHAHLAGPTNDPDAWTAEMRLDLAKFRALSHAAGAGDKLTRPFLYKATADPNAPAAGILMGPDNPDYVPLASLPPHVWRAILLCEDSDFYTHSGFDVEAIVHAFKENLRATRVRRGGSTIPQQLAKNMWLSRERTFHRKLEEALLTIALEGALEKDRILEIYINAIEWGPGVYGIQQAAHHYFAKDAKDLTPKEAAYLGTIIPSPKLYYVYFQRGGLTTNWDDHVMIVVNKMHESGDISDDEFNKATFTPIAFGGTPHEGAYPGAESTGTAP